jgi:hypothetical protein
MVVTPTNTSQDLLALPALADLTTTVELVPTRPELLALDLELLTLKLVPLALVELATLVELVSTRPELLAVDLDLLTPKPVHLVPVVLVILVLLVPTRLELLAPELEPLTLKLVPLAVAEEPFILAELVLTKPELLAVDLELLTPKLVPLAPEEPFILALLVPTKTALLALVPLLPTHKPAQPATTVELLTLALLVIPLLVPLVLEQPQLILKLAAAIPFLAVVLAQLINVVSKKFASVLVFCSSPSSGQWLVMLIHTSPPHSETPSRTLTEMLTEEH